MRNPHAFIALAAGKIGDDGLSWVETLPTAEKARNGRWYFTVTRADLDAAVAYITANPEKIPVDRDHEGSADGSTRAAGWFTGKAKVIEVAGTTPQGETQDHDSVWAEVKWTPKALEEIRDGEFRFMSPEWSFGERDQKTGLMTKFKALVASTLTNRPFFDQMAPVVASDLDCDDDVTAYAAKNGVTAGQLQKALAELPKDTPLEAVLAKARETKPDPNPVPSKEDDVDPAVLKALDLKEGATTEEIVAAVTDMREKVAITANFDKGVLEQLAKTTAKELETERELARLQRETATDTRKREREDLLAKATEQGQILPVHKDALRAVYDATPDGPEKVKAIVDASPKRTFAEIGTGEAGPEDRPEPREIRDKRGNVVTSLDDPDWLDRQAKAILAEKGKSLKTATADEYVDALEQARQRAGAR